MKSGKACLFKAIGNQILNIDEFTTVLARVDAILNSRPIAYQRLDSTTEPLTTGHFLTGSSMLEVPALDNSSVKLSIRFRLIRATIAAFWHSWHSSYLNQLQTRDKWKQQCPNVQIDDVVIVNVPIPSDLPHQRPYHCLTDRIIFFLTGF